MTTTRTIHTRLATVVAACAMSIAGVVAAPAAAAPLDTRLGTLVASSRIAGQTSVFAWDQASRDVIYTHAADRRVAPASTMKLLTGAAALARFGPEHRFETRLGLEGRQVGPAWIGDVWLVGDGDPSLSTGSFSRANFAGQGTNVARLLGPLRDRGIRSVTGSVRVDDSLLDEVRWVPEWKAAFRFEETGALGALTINEALTGRYVGSRSSRDPDLHAGGIFRELLTRDGIKVRGGVVAGTMGPEAEIVATASSQPLRVLLRHMDQQSDNFFAEILLKDIGADRFGEEGDGSTNDGRRAASAELARLGIDMSAVRWLDGSGLAYGNRVTARSIGSVLGAGAQAAWGEAWIAGFARSGTSGTLRRRMTRLPYRGRVSAKTGTLRHVSGLAGFSQRVGNERRYGFVVLTWDASGRSLDYTRTRPLQDRIAMVLVR